MRPAAVNALYHGTRERVDIGQLTAVLDGLNRLTGRSYTVADLLEYTPGDLREEGDAKETAAVLADHPDILERVRRVESGQSKLIPIEDVAAKYGIKL